MPAQCLPFLQLDAVRVTRLNSCGAVIDSACSFATSESATQLAMTNNNQDRQEYLRLNGKGEICVDKTKEPQLRWINFELTFCQVDPELFTIVTGEPVVFNDATPPVAIGWDSTQEGPLNSFFALEGWINTDDGCADGTPDYGYVVMPFAVGGQVSDVTFENGNIDFTLTGRTSRKPLWGTGPYNVRLVEAAGPDLGEPRPLLTSIGPTVHRRLFITELPPPPGVCGCQDLTPTVDVLPLAGAAPLNVTLTFPTDADGPMLPGYIDWGDASATQLVTSGVSVGHTYTLAGNYTATFRTTKYSAPTYTSATIVVS